MTSETDDTREGKGRAIPGPSSSVPGREAGGGVTHTWFTSVGAVVVLLGAAAAALFGTQAHQYSAPAALALVAAVGAFVGVLIAVGLPKRRTEGPRDWLPAALVGAAGFAAAPWLVMANRYTDAPPGSEVLFLTTASWGTLLALALALVSCERISRAGGALLALAGAATLVANWERPSSFSPFVRFVREETVMVLAGLLWVALVLVLLRAARRGSLGTTALSAALGGLAAAGVICAAALAAGTLSGADFGGAGVFGFGVATAFCTAGTLVALRSGSAGGIAGAYVFVPSAATLLIAVEQVTGPLGPQPILLGPAAAAVICTVAGIVVNTEAGRLMSAAMSRTIQGGHWALTAARASGAVAVTGAVVGLATPAMMATVNGLRADGSIFEATFSLYGWEVAGPWIAFAIALASLGLAIERPEGRRAVVRSLALLVAGAACLAGWSTPLRTLTDFIPSEVQVDYGSEFARITFAQGSLTWAWFALGGALLALTLPWFARITRRRTPDSAGAQEDVEGVSR